MKREYYVKHVAHPDWHSKPLPIWWLACLLAELGNTLVWSDNYYPDWDPSL